MENNSTISSPPSSSTVSRIVILIMRVLTFVFLFIALILIAINQETEVASDVEYKIKFNDLYSYRYMLAAIVLGFVYNLFQMILSIFNIISRKRLISGNGGYLFDFYGDKITSYLLATGAAAGFGGSHDVQRSFETFSSLSFDAFFAKALASASLLFLAFVFTAVASVFTSYALPKKV